jgi:hypothetical protein
LQVTSAVISEGKTLVAGNLAVTLREGLGLQGSVDRRRFAQADAGVTIRVEPIVWPESLVVRAGRELAPFVRRLNDMSLWLLTAGKPYEQPSDILQSPRFVEALALLGAWFDWVVVDSAPAWHFRSLVTT